MEFIKKKIFHKSKNYFSVIGIRGKLIKERYLIGINQLYKDQNGFAGFIIKKSKNTNHYLCRHILKPGSKASTYTCSVNTSKFIGYKQNDNLTNFQKNLISNYFIKSNVKKVYDNILSDEGGRFYHSQIRYMASELEKRY